MNIEDCQNFLMSKTGEEMEWMQYSSGMEFNGKIMPIIVNGAHLTDQIKEEVYA